MALLDRVSLKNIANAGGFNQQIKPKIWTLLRDENGITEVTMPEGSTGITVWVSYNQAAVLTDRGKNYQFITVRRDGKTKELDGIIGNITQRKSATMPSITDVGLNYSIELYSDGTPLAVAFWHDAKFDILIDAYEIHYKHNPEVVVK